MGLIGCWCFLGVYFVLFRFCFYFFSEEGEGRAIQTGALQQMNKMFLSLSNKQGVGSASQEIKCFEEPSEGI